MMGAFLAVQGFPILSKGTVTDKKQLDGLLNVSVEVTSLLGHIAHSQPIHQS
ncbi:MAG: hypothetical protein JO125_16870 [Chloroflexi bacterium]|nr:hypothetical protein [Chloroflexota bacterium]